MKARILCCIDDGEAAASALVAAVQLARNLKGSLVFFSVNPLLPGRGAPIFLWPDSYVSALLDVAVRKAQWEGISHVEQARCRALDVAKAIVAHADENEIDYIVLGTRDRSGVARAFGGSVSRQVIAQANCPVLAVRRIREKQQEQRGRRVGRPDALDELTLATG